MGGDMPCGKTCYNATCPWNAFGSCMDNDTCDEQIQEGETE